MAIKLEDYLARHPKEQQDAVRKRGEERIAEEAALRQLREARARSQEEVGRKLRIKQKAVTRLERRTDLY
jgi:hypothetical protein